MQLKDQAAMVTGGASGLGAATARRLAAQGAKVAICDLNTKLAEQVAAEIKGVAVTCDVADAASAEAAIAAAVNAHGPARVLVNCAGIGVAKRVVGRDGPMALADFDKVIKVNLIGTFNMLRLAATEMRLTRPHRRADHDHGADDDERAHQDVGRPLGEWHVVLRMKLRCLLQARNMDRRPVV